MLKSQQSTSNSNRILELVLVLENIKLMMNVVYWRRQNDEMKMTE